MYLTPENAKDYVGMKLYADRSIFHHYPLTVFQYPDGVYATKDSAGVCSPVSNDLFNQVWFDRAEPYREDGKALSSKGQVVLDIDDKETWGDKGTWDVDKRRG